MKVYYLRSNSRIVQVLYEDEVFKTDLFNLSPYYVLDIPEEEANKPLCLDLRRTLNKVDFNSDTKYSVKDGAIKEKPDWKEYVEDKLMWEGYDGVN